MKSHTIASSIMTLDHRSIYRDPCTMVDGPKIDVVYLERSSVLQRLLSCDAHQARKLAFMLLEAADQVEGK